MNIGISSLSLSEFNYVNTEYYNNKVASIEDAALLSNTVAGMNQMIDRYNALWALSLVYNAERKSKTAISAVKTLLPSTEVSIFGIGKAIFKALSTVCKWVLNAIHRVWDFFFGFFKRGDKDIKKDADVIHDKIPYMQSELVSPPISEVEINEWIKIIEEHCSNSSVTHSIPPGTKLDAYKNLFYTAFNSKVSTTARVNNTGALLAKPHRYQSATALSKLGWTSGDKITAALTMFATAENKVKEVLTGLREQSKEISKIASLCEKRIKGDSSELSNDDLAEKAPQCIDAACITTIMSKDTLNLKIIKDSFGKMCEVLRTRAKKYTA